MSEIISVVISCLALVISGITAWLTLFRKGTVRMTQPTMVAVLYDLSHQKTCPKVFFRTLLYSTSQKGQIIESMFIRLKRGESIQTFSRWAYDVSSSLVRGSGMYVGPEGVACHHHFLLPDDGTKFDFLPGDYRLEIYVSLVGGKQPYLLSKLQLSLTESQANALKNPDAGIFYEWGPDLGQYHASISKHTD